MVGERVLDPSVARVQSVGLGEFGRHPQIVPGEREPTGCQGNGQESLVHGHLGGEADGEVGSGQFVRDLPADQRGSDEVEGARDGTGGPNQRTAVEEPGDGSVGAGDVAQW